MPIPKPRKVRSRSVVAPASTVASAMNGGGAWLLVAAAAWIVRLVYLGQIQDAPQSHLLMGDAEAYDRWARKIAAGDLFGSGVFYQSPLYPYFLAAIYALTGGSVLAAKVAQTLLGAAACYFLGRATELWFDRRTGLIAAWMLALQPTAIFFDGLIQKTSLETFLTTLFLFALARTLRTPGHGRSIRPFIALGVALGLLSISRENSLVWAGVVVAALAWPHSATPLPVRLRHVAWFAVAMAVTMAPVAVRNRIVGGEWHLTTAQFGPNFYIGNNPAADGLYEPLRPARGEAKYEREDAVALAEQAEGRKLGPREVSQYWFRRASRWIAEHPGDWLRLLLRKLRLTCYVVEAGDTEDQYAFADLSPLLNGLTLVWNFGVLAPLAAAGAALSWRRARELWPLGVLFLAYALSVAAFYVFSRYRFPLIPLLIPFAAAFARSLYPSVRERRYNELGISALGAVCAGLAIWWPIADVTPAKFAAASYFNFGVSFAEQGDGAAAERAYRRAVELRPYYAAAWNNLGETLHRLGRDPEALEAYARALAIDEHLPQAHNNRGVIELEQGRFADAERSFRTALDIDPHFSDATMNLGNLAAHQGRHADAERLYRQALVDNPGNGAIWINLGSVLQSQDRAAEAVEALKEAVRLAPDRPEAYHNLGNALAITHRDDEAEQAFRRVLQLTPESVPTLLSLAQLELRRGRNAVAREALLKARTLAPPGSPTAAQIDQLMLRTGG